MNAVNLIPSDSRKRGERLAVSPPSLALIGGLVIVLAAAVLYVMAANTVAKRKSELAQVSVGVTGWTAAANSFASFVNLDKQRTVELADVRQLASSRFPWSHLLGQIGGLMPRGAALTSLTATSTPSTSGGAGPTVPSVQLAGCAVSQSLVAQTMVQMRLVKGVSNVSLSSSTNSSSASGSSRSSSTGSGGGCTFPVVFAVSLTLTPSATAATPATPATASAGSAATTSTPGTTTSSPSTTTTTTTAAAQ